jgi:uncharacterized protein (UPF0335 family)
VKIDKLFTHGFDRANQSQTSKNFGRGQFNGLFFTYPTGAYKEDRVTIKLRHERGVDVLANRLPIGHIAAISELQGGFVRAGLTETMRLLIGKLVDTSLAGGAADKTIIKKSFSNTMDCFALDLGNITLGESELEVTLDTVGTGVANPQSIDVYTYNLGVKPDYLKVYDFSHDLEQGHRLVRDAFLVPRSVNDMLYDSDAMSFLDLDIQMDTGKYTYLTDLMGVCISTALFSKVEDSIPNDIARLYSETDALPADCYVKITGSDAPKVSLLFIKEKIVPSATSKSTLGNLEALISRIEKLERESPEIAKAYRHAGAIKKSQELKVAKAIVENGVKKEAK